MHAFQQQMNQPQSAHEKLFEFLGGLLGLQQQLGNNQLLQQKLASYPSDEALTNAKVREANASANMQEFQNQHQDELLKAKLDDMAMNGLGGFAHGMAYLAPTDNGRNVGQEALMNALMQRGYLQPETPEMIDQRMAQKHGMSVQQYQQLKQRLSGGK